jgi:hypothetical protein
MRSAHHRGAMALAVVLTIVSAAFSQRPAERSEDVVSASFEASTEDVVNPERGFSRFAEVTVPQGALEAGRQQGHSVFGLMITLSAFRDAPISDAFLEQIRAAFDRGRAAGLKFIPRFRYDSTARGRDAPAALVLRHISQVAPILRSNRDVIVHVEAGFIGAWGEWHGSANGLTDTGFGKEVNALQPSRRGYPGAARLLTSTL